METDHNHSRYCILADIGGTYARFGILNGDGRISHCRKYEVRSFDGPEQALDHYCMQTGCAEMPRDIAIATAAWPYNGRQWRFAHSDSWVIDRDNLSSAGWRIRHMENDFTASARGILLAEREQVRLLCMPDNDETRHNDTAVVIGIGTGLGLAYAGYGPENRPVVRATFGGHMPPPRAGDDKVAQLAEIALQHRDDDKAPVAEDLVSGPGLRRLIRAAGILQGQDPGEIALDTPAIVPPDHLRPALEAFHMLLGLFINQAAQFGHAFGGVYLDGGVMSLLRDNELLDIAAIRNSLCREAVPVVRAPMAGMPIYGVEDPLISFTGLLHSLEAQYE